MDTAPKISVIIPVYNAEPYLWECLDSVVSQTLREIEIICVDDGCTDGSPATLEEYAAADPRFRILRRENGGAGAARNAGLEAARGEYLSFLDADDLFEETMLERAYEKCVAHDLDFVVFRSDAYDGQTKVQEPCPWTVKQTLLPEKEPFCWCDISHDIFRAFIGWPWDKLYKRAFILEAGLRFQKQRTSNDLYFVFGALVCAQRIAVLDAVLAHHRKNVRGSLSTTREKSPECFFAALIALREKLTELGIYEDVRQSFVNYALHFCLWNLDSLLPEDRALLHARLRGEYFDALEISRFNAEYFYHAEDYARYLEIAGKADGPSAPERPPGRLRRCFGFLLRLSAHVYKFLRSCRRHGLRHTFRLVKNRLDARRMNRIY
jgi:glycosyltransferase involved in cell wall biosynthesis